MVMRRVIANKTDAVLPARETLEAKPKELTRDQFTRLYKSVISRIPKTLAILAK